MMSSVYKRFNEGVHTFKSKAAISRTAVLFITRNKQGVAKGGCSLYIVSAHIIFPLKEQNPEAYYQHVSDLHGILSWNTKFLSRLQAKTIEKHTVHLICFSNLPTNIAIASSSVLWLSSVSNLLTIWAIFRQCLVA